jgi:hypothetical protein
MVVMGYGGNAAVLSDDVCMSFPLADTLSYHCLLSHYLTKEN